MGDERFWAGKEVARRCVVTLRDRRKRLDRCEHDERAWDGREGQPLRRSMPSCIQYGGAPGGDPIPCSRSS